MQLPFVSVVIPVYNSFSQLKKCLTALRRQTYLKELYEVIVVDNNSNKSIENLVAQFRPVRLTFESYPTLHAARNKGISISKGKVFAFTDADCIPDQDWIEKGVSKISTVSNCGLVAGKIRVFPKNSKNPSISELFEMVTAFPQKKYIQKWHFGAPANLFTLRNVIDSVGLFDGNLHSGADVEWGNRVFVRGYKQIYADDVCISHPARYSLSQLYRKQVRVIGGIHDMNKGKVRPFKNLLIDLKDDWPLLRDFLEIFLNKQLGQISQRLKVLVVMLFIKIIRVTERIKLYLKNI